MPRLYLGKMFLALHLLSAIQAKMQMGILHQAIEMPMKRCMWWRTTPMSSVRILAVMTEA